MLKICKRNQEFVINSVDCGFIAELNRFAENVYPPTGFYPPIDFILLIQAILIYSTSR
jgi:hypothetical protein